MPKLRRYRTVAECLEAIARGFVVDQKDNGVPKRVVESLRAGVTDQMWDRFGVAPQSFVRYEGLLEIWWFSGSTPSKYDAPSWARTDHVH